MRLERAEFRMEMAESYRFLRVEKCVGLGALLQQVENNEVPLELRAQAEVVVVR